MTLRAFVILTLLFGSVIAGSAIITRGIAASANTTLADNQADIKAAEPIRAEPTQKPAGNIRVILPSPYEIRVN